MTGIVSSPTSLPQGAPAGSGSDDRPVAMALPLEGKPLRCRTQPPHDLVAAASMNLLPGVTAGSDYRLAASALPLAGTPFVVPDYSLRLSGGDWRAGIAAASCSADGLPHITAAALRAVNGLQTSMGSIRWRTM